MSKKIDMWSEIRKLSDDYEVEIQMTFKSKGLVKVVVDDGHDVYSFIKGWDNIILESIKRICESIKVKREKENKELNERLSTINLSDNLFDKK